MVNKKRSEKLSFRVREGTINSIQDAYDLPENQARFRSLSEFQEYLILSGLNPPKPYECPDIFRPYIQRLLQAIEKDRTTPDVLEHLVNQIEQY